MWPLIEISLEAKDRQDSYRLGPAVESLCAADPSLRVSVDRDAGQLILSGDSEEHLERTLAALARKDGLQVKIGRPQVAYRETITKPVECTYAHKKPSGGSGEYAEVTIVFEPLERGQGFEFVDRIDDGAVPREVIPGIEKGLMIQKEDGVLAGYPVMDCRATLVDGKYHDVDSNALTFEIAARACLRKALRLAGPILLEPVMKVEIVTPDDRLGVVTGDLGRRRGQIVGQMLRVAAITVEASVPLSEMFGYRDALRGMSQGRASFSMQYDRYGAVPTGELPPDCFPPAVGMRA